MEFAHGIILIVNGQLKGHLVVEVQPPHTAHPDHER